jgi:MFS family permease
VAGNQAAITSLAAAETPAAKVGWALGVIGFSTALGRALGPVVGGALSGLTNLRVQFVTAGSIMALSMVPLPVMVRETDRRHEHSRRLSLSQQLEAAPPDTVRVLTLLILVQSTVAVVNLTVAAVPGRALDRHRGQPAGVLDRYRLRPAGHGAAVGALGYSRLVALSGYRAVATALAIGSALAVGAIGVSTQVAAVLAESCAFGVLVGGCLPTLQAMIGLESPEPLRATTYAVSGALLVAIPAVAGLLASRFGSPWWSRPLLSDPGADDTMLEFKYLIYRLAVRGA